MAAVLLMVGRGEEFPDVVRRLLDVEATPRKPQYRLASGGCWWGGDGCGLPARCGGCSVVCSPRACHTAARVLRPPHAEEPLLLYSCTYDGLTFHRSRANYGVVCGQLEDALTRWQGGDGGACVMP